MLRWIWAVLLMSTFALGLEVPAALAAAFLTEMEDLPLPAGLSENAGGMLFDSPAGRIIEATATGTVPAQKIRSFYAETLPQLGWQAQGELTFRRDNEILRIVIDEAKHPLLVHYSVVPKATHD